MNSRALVVCNGEPPTKKLARSLASHASLVVAADGGANTCKALGLTPNIILGDLDSVKPSTLRYFRKAEVIRVRRQDNTDLEKVLDELSKRKIMDVDILAAIGKRLDFTLGNLSIVWKYTLRMNIAFHGDSFLAVPIDGRLSMKAKRGTTISLLPFGHCGGITLRGLRYPLTNASMRVGDIGVSNVVKKSPFNISVKRGKMLLIVARDS